MTLNDCAKYFIKCFCVQVSRQTDRKLAEEHHIRVDTQTENTTVGMCLFQPFMHSFLPSYGGPIELFLIPASAQQLV